jgi:hypothetical protein
MAWLSASAFLRIALLVLVVAALTAALSQTRARYASNRQSPTQQLPIRLAQAQPSVLDRQPPQAPAIHLSRPPQAPGTEAALDVDRELARTLVPGLLEMGVTVTSMSPDDDGRAVLAAINGMRRQEGLPPFEHMDQAVADYLDIEVDRYRERQANILRIQIALHALGFDPGPVDSLLGPRTTQAIRRYQERAGMPVTGELSDAEIDALEILSFDRSARRRRGG